MNNSDFLSDAVALDLGKSGVKVAETLEIQVGEEWWRLINAADVMDARVFQKRFPSEPIVVGGEIHLDGMSRNIGHIFRPNTGGTGDYVTQQKCVAIGVDALGEFVFASFGSADNTGSRSYAASNHGLPSFRVYDADGTLKGEVARAIPMSSGVNYWDYHLFWDGVNSRFIGVTRGMGSAPYSEEIWTHSTPVNGSSYSGGSTPSYFAGNSKLHELKTFLEMPDKAYSIFLHNGEFYFKETNITAGVNYITLSEEIFNFATVLPKLAQIQNHSGSAFLFYSRGFNSVGVLWRDSTAGVMRFVLQSENFATIHDLQDTASSASKKIISAGNMVISQEGEFLIVGVADTPSGTLQFPVGWSFPANFTIVGTGEIASEKGVIIARVGMTIYRLELDLDTKNITKVFSMSSEYTLSRNVYLLHASATHEIWVEEDPDYAWPGQWSMFCIDVVNETLQWHFGEMQARLTGLYSSSYPNMPGQIKRLSETHLCIKSIQYASNSNSRRYSCHIVPISALLACSSTAALVSALTSTYPVVSIPQSVQSGTSMSTGNENSYIVHQQCNNMIEDDAYYYMACAYSYTPGYWAQKFSKNNFTWASPMNNYTVRNAVDVDGPSHVVAPQAYITPGLGYTYIGGPSATSDGFLALATASIRGVTSYPSANIYWLGYHFITYSSTGSVIHHWVTCGIVPYGFGRAGQSYSNNVITAMPLDDDPNSRISFTYFDNTLMVAGAHHSAAVSAGYGQKITLPFNPTIGMGCYQSRRYIVFSNVSGGQIQWAEVDGRCGQYRKYYAYKITDPTDIYEVTGLDVPGGFVEINFQGAAISGITGVGRTAMVDTGASPDEGYGGGGETHSSVTYSYSDNTYTPYPFAREGIRAELSNISKTTKITLPETQDNLIRGMLAAGTDFRGSRCILRRVFPDHIDEPGADIVLLDGYIQDWSYVPGKKGIAFSVSKTLIDVGAQFPKRLMNMGCSHVFKGARCQYLGEEGRCLKTRAFCTSLGNLNQFGGFPWVAARQRRVMWK